jgi:hypothetical protein
MLSSTEATLTKRPAIIFLWYVPKPIPNFPARKAQKCHLKMVSGDAGEKKSLIFIETDSLESISRPLVRLLLSVQVDTDPGILGLERLQRKNPSSGSRDYSS